MSQNERRITVLIDCAACPARNRECDDCVMQVLFSPVTSGYVTDRESGEMFAAVDVFVATDMISTQTAHAALEDVRAGQDGIEGSGGGWLRAV